jgi:hypothetical protein
LKKEGAQKGEYSMVGYLLKNTLSDHGSVNRGICITDEEGRLQRIFEGMKIQKKDGGIYHHTNDKPETLEAGCVVSMNFWGFQSDIFDFLETDFHRHVHASKQDPKSEYFIPFVVNDMMEKGMAKVRVIPTNASWQGVTYQEDRPMVVESLKKLSDKEEYPLNF